MFLTPTRIRTVQARQEKPPVVPGICYDPQIRVVTPPLNSLEPRLFLYTFI